MPKYEEMTGALERQSLLVTEALEADEEFRMLVSEAPPFLMFSTVQMLDIIPEQHRGSPRAIVEFLVRDYLRLRGYRMAGVNPDGAERWVPNNFSGGISDKRPTLRVVPNADMEDRAVELITEGIKTPRKLASELGIPVEDVKVVLTTLVDARRIRKSNNGRFAGYVAVDSGGTVEEISPKPDALSPSAAAVLEAIKSGNDQTSGIARTTGLPVNTVRAATGALTAKGLIRREGEGQQTHYVVV